MGWTTDDGVGKVVYNPFATQKTEGLAGDEEGNYIPFTGEGGGGDGHSSSRRLLAGGGTGSGGGSGNDCGRSFCSNFNAGWHGDDNVNFPGSANGHIRNANLFPAGATNVMSPGLSYTTATSFETAFNTLNMAYLREQVFYGN